MLAKHEVSIVGSPAARRTWTTSSGFREHPHRAAGFHMSDRQAKRDEAREAVSITEEWLEGLRGR